MLAAKKSFAIVKIATMPATPTTMSAKEEKKANVLIFFRT